ncbi:uncharacterized protein LOC143503131 [Brachyhypopomus gauderio]|uniref:uncharacterized protein LOC143503131 n=1 Tax=Brachyhypopomus gauderio TaxID=698409 RepID=UPI004040F2C9
MAAVEGDPRRCRTAGVGAGDELELSFLKEDECGVFEKLAHMLNEDDTSTIVDLPGSVLEERAEAGASGVPLAGWRDGLWEQMKERREEVIPHYVEQLREQVQDDMIPVGRSSPEQDEDADRGLVEREWARKRRLMAVLRGAAKESLPIRDVEQEETVLQERLYAAFQRAESRLLNALRQRQAEVIAQYGEISEVTLNNEPLVIESDLPWQAAMVYGGRERKKKREKKEKDRRRESKKEREGEREREEEGEREGSSFEEGCKCGEIVVEWVRAPQPVEVCVGRLRAVREKLARGPYVVSVTLHRRLGGPPLIWSGLKGQRWVGVTEAVEHGGRHCDVDLCFEQDLPMGQGLWDRRQPECRSETKREENDDKDFEDSHM